MPRSSCAPFVVASLLVAFAGCSSSSNDGSDGPGSGNSDGGSATTNDGGSSTTTDGGKGGDSDGGGFVDPSANDIVADGLDVAVAVVCDLPVGKALTDCVLNAQLLVYSYGTTTLVTDATVTVSHDGGSTMSLPYDTNHAAYVDTTLAKTYHFDVTHGSAHAVVTGTMPADFTMTVTPAAVAVGGTANVTWTPSADPAVNEPGIAVIAPTSGVFTLPLANDSGSADLPASAFPEAGGYSVRLIKTQRTLVAPSSVQGSVRSAFQVIHTTMVTAS